MNAKPFFSVLMPVCNGAAFLPDALASLRDQETVEGDWEAIATDDGSGDGSRDMLAAAAREMPIRVVDGARCGNWVASTNKALALARGEWVVFLHQDDAFAPSRLRRLKEAAEQFPGCGFLANDTRFFGSNGRDLGRWRAPLAEGYSTPGQCFPPIFVQDNFAVPGVAVRRDLLVETGGLDEGLPYTADWDAWLRFSGMTGVVRVAEDLSFFRVHGNSQTVVSFAARRDAMRANLETAFNRHLPTLHSLLPPREAARWERLARLGLAADLFLAAAGMGGPLPVRRLLKAAFRAGPHRWGTFLRLHGTVQRVLPRLRARINGKRAPGVSVPGKETEP